MTTVFQQAIQLVALGLGIGFLNEFAAIGAGEPMQDLVWKLLMSLAFIYLATRVPSLLGNVGTFDAWLHALHFGMSLPGSMARSARSVGLLAGGSAAGGPVGAAVAAGAAGGVASAPPRACARRPIWQPPLRAAAPLTAARPGAAASSDNNRNQVARPLRADRDANGGGRCAGRRTSSSTERRTRTRKRERSEIQVEDLTQTISNLVGILLSGVGAIGVGFFIYGSYLYLTASGAPH